MDYGRFVRNSFTLWVKDGQMHKYMLGYILLQLAFLGILVGTIYLFFWPLISRLSTLFSGAGAMAGPQEFIEISKIFLSGLVPFVLVMVPLVIAAVLVSIYLSLLMTIRGLEQLGFSCAPFGFMKLLRAIILSLWVSIASIVSWYERKLMYVFIGVAFLWLLSFLFLFFIPAGGVVLLVLSGIASFVYLFVIIYNSIRLSLSTTIFLHKEQSIAETSRESWELSKGKAAEIFLASLLAVAMLVVASMVLGLSLVIMRLVVTLATGNLLIGLGLEYAIQILISPIWLAIGTYMFPAIYYEVVSAGSYTPFSRQPSQATSMPPTNQAIGEASPSSAPVQWPSKESPGTRKAGAAAKSPASRKK